MSNELTYSYHTFLFPFIWKTEPEITLGKFEEILQIGKNWTERKWNVLMQAQDVSKDEKKKDEWFQNYAAYQYLPQLRTMRFSMQTEWALSGAMY